MAIILNLDPTSHWLVTRAFVRACAAASGDLHERLLSSLRVVCRSEPFIVTEEGRVWVMATITREGCEREDLPAVSALLARLVAEGAKT
jgi:hypothetical protein